jgi:hypothetical protein
LPIFGFKLPDALLVTEHDVRSGLDVAMVLLDQVIQILRRSNRGIFGQQAVISRSKCRPSNYSSRLFSLLIGDHQFVQSHTLTDFTSPLAPVPAREGDAPLQISASPATFRFGP